ncbi:hypothetical protein DFR70_103459 [Nocardia tenerifensis]|uniref:Uncharacterized protein n=1 Tax=Nocardia tenerifensis TaxID=228006 RepID=A0A318K504_9NOCA|nr:hypothetical protein DFR70_103459 [Nocardia tenerifensis]
MPERGFVGARQAVEVGGRALMDEVSSQRFATDESRRAELGILFAAGMPQVASATSIGALYGEHQAIGTFSVTAAFGRCSRPPTPRSHGWTETAQS